MLFRRHRVAAFSGLLYRTDTTLASSHPGPLPTEHLAAGSERQAGVKIDQNGRGNAHLANQSRWGGDYRGMQLLHSREKGTEGFPYALGRKGAGPGDMHMLVVRVHLLKLVAVATTPARQLYRRQRIALISGG